MPCVARIVLACLTVGSLCVPVRADEMPEVVVSGLNNPGGLAIQPQSDIVFIAERGAGRVVRVVDGRVQEVVVGFAPAGAAPAAPAELGTWSLHFLAPQALAVAAAGSAADAARLYVLRVPPPGDVPVAADAAFALSIAGATTAGPVRLRGIAGNGGLLFCAVEGTDGQGWLARCALANSAELQLAASYGPFERLTAAPAAGVREVDRAVTVAPRGELVVAQSQRIDDAATEGLLAFYRATDGKRLLQLPIGLSQVDALAYGARRDNTSSPFLYALENAAAVAGGGLYRLDAAIEAGKIQVRTHRIAALERPTAMALGNDGALYVTVAEAAQPDANPPAGKLLRFASGL